MDTAPFAVTLLAASLAVHLTMLAGAAVAAYRRLRPRPGGVAPLRRRTLSVLKPLAGMDDDLAANLASFARLEHPAHEVLFGVASLDDPAVPTVRAWMRAHRHVDARLVVTERDAALNPKVAQLIGLARAARGDVLVISDSNVRVRADYLDALEREIDEAPRVGLVTSLFVGTGESSFGAAVENLQICSFVAPVVAASALFARCSLTVGKSMAITREALVAVGGFEAVGHVLAEDHLLGRRVHDAGFAVRLSFAPIENRNVGCDISRAMERHTRWAKMRRAITPGAFALEPFADPLLVACFVALLLPSPLTFAALALVLPWKVVAAWAVTWLLRGHPLPLRYLPLELSRSALGFVCWARACFSRRIEWRGHPFVLGPDSTITPVAPRPPAVAAPSTSRRRALG